MFALPFQSCVVKHYNNNNNNNNNNNVLCVYVCVCVCARVCCACNTVFRNISLQNIFNDKILVSDIFVIAVCQNCNLRTPSIQ